jgi:hypothetical protein
MLKSKVLIGALLISNAFAGVMWWRSQRQVRQLSDESRIFAKQHKITLKENNSLQEAIVSEREPSLKLSALNNTTLGKCVFEHPKNAQDYCIGPDTVVKGYQKILNRSGSSYKVGSLLRQISNTESLKTGQLQPLPPDHANRSQ